jgi:hypothetical protein
MGSCGQKCHIQRTLAVMVLLALIAIAGGILIWQFLPDHQKQALSGITSGGIPLGGGAGEAPAPNYTFIQCSSDGYDTCCNGLNGLCNLTLTDILYAGVHNAQSSSEDGFYVAPNHQYHAVSALDYGYRTLNFDVGICDGNLVFVHGLCELGTTDPLLTFTEINQWLDAHPTEVIIIPFQVVNELEAPVDLYQLYDIFASIDGFTNRMFTKELGEPWPSLGTMVENDQRIVVFQYNAEKSCSDALFGINSNYTCPPGFQDWFAYAGESQFQFDKVDDLNNKERACNITRGRPRGPLYALNVFLEIPSKKIQSTSLNTKSFLQDHISICSHINNGLPVNVVFVDFWSEGNLPEVVQLHNTALLQSQ